MLPIPLTKRTTAAVSVFACLFAARNAQKLSTNPATIGSLNSEHAQLFSIYRKLLHQDVANQSSVLAGIINQAVTAVELLNTTVQAMPPAVPPSEDMFALSDLQIVVANALTNLQSAQSDE